MWEFVSAAYVLNALRSRKYITPAQQIALHKILARGQSMGKSPRDYKTSTQRYTRLHER